MDPQSTHTGFEDPFSLKSFRALQLMHSLYYLILFHVHACGPEICRCGLAGPPASEAGSGDVWVTQAQWPCKPYLSPMAK